LKGTDPEDLVIPLDPAHATGAGATPCTEHGGTAVRGYSTVRPHFRSNDVRTPPDRESVLPVVAVPRPRHVARSAGFAAAAPAAGASARRTPAAGAGAADDAVLDRPRARLPEEPAARGQPHRPGRSARRW